MSEEHPSRGEHYFNDSPAHPQITTTFTIAGPAGPIEIEASSGVFSSRGLDKGTAVLLDSFDRHPLPRMPNDSVLLDLGCGVGPVALFLAAWFPECRVVAVDVNRRALELCARNARRNNLNNVVCRHPDEIPSDISVDLIISNPPIRIGKQPLHDLLSSWLARLAPHGQCRLVVSRNLGADSLAGWLASQGFEVTRLESKKGFRVLEVTHSPRLKH